MARLEIMARLAPPVSRPGSSTSQYGLAAAVAEHGQAIEREARPGAVPHEALAPFVVVGLDADCRLAVEPSRSAVNGPRFFGSKHALASPVREAPR